MSFSLQLKLLVWKNYTLRKRQWVRICLVIKIWGLRISFQGRLIVEIVWPLILFIILFLVRLRGLKKYHHECKLLSVIWNFVSPINFVLFRSLWGEGDAFSRVPSFCSKFHLYFQQHLPQRHMDPAWQASGVQQFIVSIVFYLLYKVCKCHFSSAWIKLLEMLKMHLSTILTRKRKFHLWSKYSQTSSYSEICSQDFNLILKQSQKMVWFFILYHCVDGAIYYYFFFSTWFQSPITGVGPGVIPCWSSRFSSI